MQLDTQLIMMMAIAFFAGRMLERDISEKKKRR